MTTPETSGEHPATAEPASPSEPGSSAGAAAVPAAEPVPAVAAPEVAAGVAAALEPGPAVEPVSSVEAVAATAPIMTGPVPVGGAGTVSAMSDEQLSAVRQVQRMTRLMVGVLVAISAVLFLQRVMEPVDLSAGKPWRVSSKWIDCDQSIGRCGPHVTRILFHTNEDESPWFEVDLGAPAAFSSVTVVNRSDHMPERAVPLVIEAGDDQQTWRELARRDDVFATWRAKFPTTTARFVRLRVPRKTFLHLEAVRVHP
jgi:hypothetical protein